MFKDGWDQLNPPQPGRVMYTNTDRPKPTVTRKPDGGPSAYYDFPTEYKTVNDIIEDKSETQWKEHTWHLANMFKALWRWGNKDGTSLEYDTKKLIYSGCRVLRKMVGNEKFREYLEKDILEDPQFN